MTHGDEYTSLYRRISSGDSGQPEIENPSRHLSAVRFSEWRKNLSSREKVEIEIDMTCCDIAGFRIEPENETKKVVNAQNV